MNTRGEFVTVSVSVLFAVFAGLLVSLSVNVSGKDPATVGVPVRAP